MATQENENSEPNFEDTVQQVKEVDNIEDPVAEASNIRVKERDLKVISQTFEASNYEVEEIFMSLSLRKTRPTGALSVRKLKQIKLR